MKKKILKQSAVGVLLLCSALAAPAMTTQTKYGTQKDIKRGLSLSDLRQGNSNGFFTPGYAEVRGRIEDYNPETGKKNLLVYIEDNLIGEMEPKSVDIAYDGSFIVWLPLTTPGTERFVYDDEYFDLFLEPERTLEVSFNWKDVKEYCSSRKKGEQMSGCPFRFGGELRRINEELAAFPEIVSYGVYKMAHDLTPSEAMTSLTVDYEESLQRVREYIQGKDLHPTTRKLLEANVKSKYLFDIFEYARTRGNYQRTDTLAQSLKEPLGLEYFDKVKVLLAENDEWMVASRYFGGIPNIMALCSIPELLGYENHHIRDLGPNDFPYLKSLGVTLTPEEEEANQWIGDGGLRSCTWKEYSYMSGAARRAAERNGLLDEYQKYKQPYYDSLANVGGKPLLPDVTTNVKNHNEKLREYLGVEELPLVWQVAQANALRTKYMLSPNWYKDKEALFDVVEDLKNSGEFTNPAIIESVENYYRRQYAQKSFNIPDDERGKIIKDIINPYAGKMLLLDFWEIWCGPCCHAIKTSMKSREKNRNHPDFKMLFISGDRGAENGRYEDFVGKYLEGETCYLISEPDFHMMRDLFGFSGIPRYVLINKEGKVLDSDFQFYRMKKALAEYGVELEGDVLEELMEASAKDE